jgi:hypothetical protein
LYWCFHALSLYYTRDIYLFLASRMFLWRLVTITLRIILS